MNVRSYRVLLIMTCVSMMAAALFALARPAAAMGTGSLTVVATGDSAENPFQFFGTLGVWELNVGETFTRTQLDAGEYTVFEKFEPGFDIDVSCDSATTDISDANNEAVEVVILDGQDVTCTFTNTFVGGSITLITASDPAGLTDLFYFGDLGTFNQSDGISRTVDVNPGTYSVFQSKPAGFLTSFDCNTPNVVETESPNDVKADITVGVNENVVCTVNNDKNSGKLTVTATGADGLTFFGTGPLGQFTLDDNGSIEFDNLDAGDYDLFQSIPAGFLTDIDCGDIPVTDISEGTNAGRRITVEARADITCAFTNTDVGGSITVVAAGDSASAPYNYFTGSGETFSLTVGSVFSFTSLYPGDYDIFQEIEDGYDVELTCDSAVSSNVGDSNNAGARVSLMANEDVICTAQNTFVGASIVIVTTGEGFADPFTYFGAFNNFSQTVGISTTYSALLPGQYEIFQDVPPAYISSVSCDAPFDDLSSANDIGVRVTIDAFETVVCTYDNDDISGRVTVTASGDAGDAPFAFTGTLGAFSLNAGESFTVERVVPGDIIIEEAVPVGFNVTASCTSGTTDTGNGIGTVGITSTVATDDDIVCTFDHVDVGGSITVNAISDPAGLTGIEFFGDLGSFTLDHGGSFDSGALYAGTYTVSQNAITDYLLSIECDGSSSTISANSVVIELAANEDVACTFTNTDDSEEEALIVNGDFELGQGEGWHEYSRRHFDLVVDADAYGGSIDPLSGDYMAWLGGGRWERSYLWQSVTLPEGQSTSLEFSYEIKSRDWCGYDWGTVYVFDGTRGYLLWSRSLCRATSTNGWQSQSVDLSAFAGQTVAVTFFASNDRWLHSSLFLDDVSIETGAALRSVPSRAGLHSVDARDMDVSEAMMLDQSFLIARDGQEMRTETMVDDAPDAPRDTPEDVTAVALSNTATAASSTVLMLVAALSVLAASTAAIVRRKA